MDQASSPQQNVGATDNTDKTQPLVDSNALHEPKAKSSAWGQVKTVANVHGTTEKEAASVGQFDHEVDATISNVSGKNGEAKADGSNIILDSDGNKKTKVKATVDHGTFTGNVNAVAQGRTVMRGEQTMQQASMAVARSKEFADRMKTVLDDAIFDDGSDNSVTSIEDTLCAFKNTPMDLSADHYQQITGYLEDVEKAFKRSGTNRQRKIEKLTALTTVLGKIQAAHLGGGGAGKVENTAIARASNNVVGGNLVQAATTNGDVNMKIVNNIATAKAHPVPSQSLFPAETFVGREDDLEIIKTHIREYEPIRIVAHRGMGKSALVAQALKEIPKQVLSSLYPGGIIVCQFNDRPNIFVQVEHIIKSLNPEDKIDGDRIELMGRVLGVKRCLVMLDGLEDIEYPDQQKDKTDSLFRQFINAMGSSGLVITTTDGTQGRGQKLHLTPLEEGPALLESMIERQDPDSKKLCDALGNVPLAIRLAGHYIKEGNDAVASYLEWIQTEEAEEAGLAEEMEAGEKYKSIKKMMERSVEILSPLAKSGLGVLGHLALQGFESKVLEVALEIDGRAVNRVIMNLKQYGMIRNAGTGAGWYQLEHALVQSYARKCMPVNEEGLSRVGQYYNDLSQAHRNAAGYKVLDLEKDHMVSIAGHLMRQVSSRSLGFRLVDSMADYLDRQGHSEDRRVLLEIQEQEARESGDKAAEAASLCNLGTVYRVRGELSQAKEMYQKALEMEKELGSKAGMARNYGNLGNLYKTRGELRQAEKMHLKALELNQALGSKEGMVINYGNLGNVYKTRGELSEAEEMYQKSFKMEKELGHKEGMANDYCNLGNVYNIRGELSQAEEMYQKSLKMAKELGSKAVMARSYCNLGNVHKTRGELSQAEEMYQMSLKIETELGSKTGIGSNYGNLGNVYRIQGKLSQAEEMYQKALELNQAIGRKAGMANQYGNLGNVYRVRGELSQAEEMYQKALELNQAIGRKEGMAINYGNLGNVYEIRGEL